jgi:hypothetical protein
MISSKFNIFDFGEADDLYYSVTKHQKKRGGNHLLFCLATATARFFATCRACGMSVSTGFAAIGFAVCHDCCIEGDDARTFRTGTFGFSNSWHGFNPIQLNLLYMNIYS